MNIVCSSVLAAADAMATSQVPPVPQPIQQTEDSPQPTLQQGYIQECEGYLYRQSRILKRWKREWLKIVPGICHSHLTTHFVCLVSYEVSSYPPTILQQDSPCPPPSRLVDLGC